MGLRSKRWFSIGTACILLAAGCASPQVEANQSEVNAQSVAGESLAEGQATAVFAMGCFWCAEADFEKLDGVVTVVSGYTGGGPGESNI
jgi:hypothetical protein